MANASTFDPSGMSYDTQRRLKKVGEIPLEEDEENELNSIISQMGEKKIKSLGRWFQYMPTIMMADINWVVFTYILPFYLEICLFPSFIQAFLSQGLKKKSECNQDLEF